MLQTSIAPDFGQDSFRRQCTTYLTDTYAAISSADPTTFAQHRLTSISLYRASPSADNCYSRDIGRTSCEPLRPGRYFVSGVLLKNSWANNLWAHRLTSKLSIVPPPLRSTPDDVRPPELAHMDNVYKAMWAVLLPVQQFNRASAQQRQTLVCPL
ncbi:MAG: hypothetical protein U0694_03950 [Anaerolineae bacterium]